MPPVVMLPGNVLLDPAKPPRWVTKRSVESFEKLRSFWSSGFWWSYDASNRTR